MYCIFVNVISVTQLVLQLCSQLYTVYEKKVDILNSSMKNKKYRQICMQFESKHWHMWFWYLLVTLHLTIFTNDLLNLMLVVKTEYMNHQSYTLHFRQNNINCHFSCSASFDYLLLVFFLLKADFSSSKQCFYCVFVVKKTDFFLLCLLEKLRWVCLFMFLSLVWLEISALRGSIYFGW